MATKEAAIDAEAPAAHKWSAAATTQLCVCF